MKVFNVTKPGLSTTVQDLGRYGYLKYGVPISGAMDAFSLAAANVLVGNKPGDAGLEVTLIGPELLLLTKMQVAITGAAVCPKIDGQDVPMWQALNLEEEDVVSFSRMESGCRVYMAVRGGVNAPLVLRSRSTYVRGGFGGINGRQLRTGDIVEGFEAEPLDTMHRMPQELVPKFTHHFQVQAVLGPQADMFTEKGVDTFFSSEYRVTPEADRMGYRLEGPLIEHKGKADIVSDALLPGSVQVPKNGKPIVIMRDAQTTGGYPKIAVITTPDVSLLGQAKPNDMIEFSEVTLSQAQERLREYSRLINGLNRMLVKAV